MKRQISQGTGIKAWARDENGASTVEFVVLLPFLIGMLGLIGSASLYFAVSSDVQQLAHELARASLSVADNGNWCDDLRTTRATALAQNLPTLNPERVSAVDCAHDQASGLLRVTVLYDTRGTLGEILGSAIGLQFDSFQRSSFIQW
ncbi:TadE/TadG family type IV pilus assembly protein [Pararhodobacter zhoushanensis]|uniref:Pilus assembly protein n=1 Tax=Pararhodobacter zhoushanensis TaxID=2479545 RepID=A0ABT3H1G3_9RHOB|nr:TadE/TadG family type IV pilus assembly protein [Pararhodobacter zhoushanensis]MCW1933634.1 pilus assembly protein [Pararhodobacter zhoushanensis]